MQASAHLARLVDDVRGDSTADRLLQLHSLEHHRPGRIAEACNGGVYVGTSELL